MKFQPVCFSVSPVGSQTHPVFISSVSAFVIEIDIFRSGIIFSHWSTQLWSQSHYNKKRLLESPKTASSHSPDTKSKGIPHPRSSVRLILKDSKDAKMMLSIIFLFKGCCNLNQVTVGQTRYLCCNKSSLLLSAVTWFPRDLDYLDILQVITWAH